MNKQPLPINLAMTFNGMGDTVCSLPIIKFLIENNTFNNIYNIYTVYPDIFDFLVPKINLWPLSKCVGYHRNSLSPYVSPLTMHLIDYSSITLANTLLDDRSLPLYPTENIDVSHYNIDFGNTFLISSNWTELNRRLPVSIINFLIDYIISKDPSPVT